MCIYLSSLYINIFSILLGIKLIKACIIISISYCSFPYLANAITKAIPAMAVILFIFTMASLLKTAFSDPGIIPRATQNEENYIERHIGIYFFIFMYTPLAPL